MANLLEQKKALDEFLASYNLIQKINLEDTKLLVKESLDYYSRKSGEPSFLKSLTDKWYESLLEGEPDYSIYDDDLYFIDLWSCWTIYSRKYLKSVKSYTPVFNMIKESDSIVDLGCGIGYTTALLKQMFPEVSVWGTNIPGTRQYDFCKSMAEKYGFIVAPDVESVPQGVVSIFASEYFEHIEKPLEHLQEILDRLNPKTLVIANAFNTRTPGHFLEYKDHNEKIPQEKISKRFNTVFLGKGYKKVKTPFWNNRPNVWVKVIGSTGFGFV